MSYDDAARALFQVPHGDFVAERKRLAADLKAAGDKLGASRISRLQRPPVTAWAVNQLYWHARDAVDTLFELAARLRNGDLSATTAHREALAKLRSRAAAMLADAGHGANEATLRRIALTLSAVAAAGNWMPDAPGQLSADRDPPGFDAVGVINAPAAPLPEKTESPKYDFNAPIEPMVAAIAPPPPPPTTPKRSAVEELAAKRKEQAEEEKRRKAAEKRGEEYVPPPKAEPKVEPPKAVAAPEPDDEAEEAEEEEEIIAPRPRTLSLVPPLPVEPAAIEAQDDAAEQDEDNDDDEEDSDDDDDDDADEDAEAPAPAAPKLSALEQLRARKKQQAEEAEEERRRKFMEDGGTRDRVIAKRMIEAQERNRSDTDAKRERVEAAVRTKLDAQRTSAEAHRVTHAPDSGDDDSDDDNDDTDTATDAPALTVQPGGRADSPSKGPPQPGELLAALAAKLGATPPTSTSAKAGPPSTRTPSAASPPRAPASPTPSMGASPPRAGTAPTLSTGPSPARHVPENTKPPGSFPRPRTPSPSTLAPSATPAPSAPLGKPAGMTDAERRKIDARAKLKAEIETRLRTANTEVLAAEQRVEKLTAELAEADDALEASRAVVEDLRDKLDALD
jgi:chemotaxis protein histidine kinase CheA